MAKRRDAVETSDADVMPAKLLAPGARVARRQWFAARGLYEWKAQHAAIKRAHDELDDGEPSADPRELLRGLNNDSTSFVKRRRP